VRAGAAGAASEAIRGSRAQRVAVAASGVLGVSSTRRAAVLALVVCALALTVAVPLRNYLAQRHELTTLETRQHQLSSQVDELTRRRDELRDPDHVRAEARERLGYVSPGEVPYIVQLPGNAVPASPRPGSPGTAPWLETLWNDVRGIPR
jgi:cell division protein FtsB